MKAPFPWFGGKSSVADLVWDRFGNTPNYVEPFAGSLAVLLSRPHGPGKNETVNDKDCYLSNFWHAISVDPEQVAFYADWPVNEADLHSRHKWLVEQQGFRERMMSDPEYFDAKIAGWWVWGLSLWIGSGWCVRPEWTGRGSAAAKARGIHTALPQKRVTLKRQGTGVHCSGYALETWKVRPRLQPQGVTRQLPDISGGRGVHGKYAVNLTEYFEALATRLRRVRVCCGDWRRVLGPSPTVHIGLTAVFLDPPYSSATRADVYAEESRSLATEVAQWAIDNGSDPRLRIALCGYEDEHALPADWVCLAWKANGGYGNQGAGTNGRSNAGRERIWFSPSCLRTTLFDHADLLPEAAHG